MACKSSMQAASLLHVNTEAELIGIGMHSRAEPNHFPHREMDLVMRVQPHDAQG